MNPPEPTPPDDNDDRERRERELAGRFAAEVIALLSGVFIGFFWSQYFEKVHEEAHIIVLLLIVVFCLTRYIYLTRR